MSQHVDAILQQIESLDETDRLAIEQRLRVLADAQWEQEVRGARAMARERGIDQQSIDRAVEEVRYGS